jgi:hypothetical protein
MKGMGLPKLTRFSILWWDRVVGEWNVSEHPGILGGLGTICFEVLDRDPLTVYLTWDHLGYAERLESPVEDAVRFSANATDWDAFIDQEFTATIGIFSGRLIYKGSLRRILPYSIAFNVLAKVAQRVK